MRRASDDVRERLFLYRPESLVVVVKEGYDLGNQIHLYVGYGRMSNASNGVGAGLLDFIPLASVAVCQERHTV